MNKRGISLIALAVVIMVMLTLAGATILSLGDSDIITRAEETVEDANERQIQELAAGAWTKAYTQGLRTKEELEKAVLDYLDANGIDKNMQSQYSIDVTTSGAYVVKSVIGYVDGVPIPKGFVASKATGEDKKDKGLVIYAGTTPVTNDNVETAKRTRNQFVWIPIPQEEFETNFVRKNFGLSYTISNELGKDYWEIELDENNMPKEEQTPGYITNKTLEEAIDMYESVKKYGGFYIARYEAGLDKQRSSIEDTIQKGSNVYFTMGKIPYNNVWKQSGQNHIERVKAPVEIARSIYPKTNLKYGVVSTLTYGVQLDTIITWLASMNVQYTGIGNYIDVDILSADNLNTGALISAGVPLTEFISKNDYTFSKGTEAWLLSTGALERAKINNIYDMTGNLSEITMENANIASKPDVIFNVPRDMSYLHSEGNGLLYRGSNIPTNDPQLFGFRAALYIK